MNQQLTDQDYFDILFTALEKESVIIPDFLAAKQKEYENLLTPKMFFYNLKTAFDWLIEAYKASWVDAKREKNINPGYTDPRSEIPNVPLNTLHITGKIYRWGTFFSADTLKTLNDALASYLSLLTSKENNQARPRQAMS
jgi:hypothetical protein